MAREHWFDRLHKALIHPAPRRTALRGASSLVAGLLLRHATESTRARNSKKRSKSKSKHKGKGKRGKRPPAHQPSPNDSCASFPAAADRAFCRFKRDECPQYALEFCIVEGDPTNPAKVAVCCPPDATCCGDVCCPIHSRPGLKCCPAEGCVQTRTDRLHCGNCFNECASDEECVDGACQDCPTGQTRCGQACADLNTSDQNCGFCGRTCSPDQNCVNGECVDSTAPCAPGLTYCPPQGCVDTTTSAGHCGACGNTCDDGALRYCVGGQCGCHPSSSDVPCGNACIPHGYACCVGPNGFYGCSHECGPPGGCA